MSTKMKKYHIIAKDGYQLSVHTFDVENPDAVIQVIHGMEEHQGRYEDFAHFLNSQGFCVVTSDMRGHGYEAEKLGHFGDRGGYRQLIYDQIRIRAFIHRHYPDLPVYLFCHSMGTIIARVLLQTQSRHYQKAALSGYPNYQAATAVGIALSDIIRIFRGSEYKSGLLRNLSLGAFNRAIENPQTDADWVCGNPDVLAAYQNDPYCGFGFTCAAFNDLFRLVQKMHEPANYRKINGQLSFLLLRGGEDPCTGGDKGAADSLAVLKEAGFSHFKEIVYPDMRHEILNEKGKQEVYEDVAAFFRSA